MNDNDFKSKKNVLKGGNYWQKQTSFGSIVKKKPKSIDERFLGTAKKTLSSLTGQKLSLNLGKKSKLTIGKFGAISAGEPGRRKWEGGQGKGKATPIYGAKLSWKF
jgi:hypothetical protein